MIELTEKEPQEFKGDLLVYFAGQREDKMVELPAGPVKKAVRTAWKAGDFSGKKGETFLFYPALAGAGAAGELRARRVLVVGLGTPAEDVPARREQVRLAAGTAAARACSLKAGKVLVVLPARVALAPEEIAECTAEGLILANYRFDRYRKPDPEKEDTAPVERFLLHGGGLAAGSVRSGMKAGAAAARAACSARDMANEPGNGWTPSSFADHARKLARRRDMKCRVLDRGAMKKLGMGGILGVSQGSAQPPRLVILEYRSGRKNPTLLLVGKGLTFDSGGISIKPASGMEEMKYDMCGGAAVLAAMEVVGREKPAGLNVVALVPATENLPGGAALKPGDIISHYGGTTSEIINTDAEGRLILADALAYGIETFRPAAVIDLATLTGAVIIGLGHHRTGLLANDDDLAEALLEAGDLAGEPLWRLPLGPEYRKQLDSQVADIKNTGGRPAGTITAAAYLQEFVGDVPWAHLDIAGTAWNSTEKSYIPKKAPSGIGVRTLLQFIRRSIATNYWG